ncbi:hypothetical protein U9M48_044409 [Paspalum notatum var. saurae]|uniref:Reverse transcriptase domain-containing protein n=1 Tax=Paspalum notatum var. saurae TaxID=547442 RepID=A0AAQ3XI82_PASNO
MIAFLLSTSSSRVLLNGVPIQPIHHGRGLRQGDPFSPLLFVITFDPLQRLLKLATEMEIFSKMRGRTPGIRISMYADDAALFLAPSKEEVSALSKLLNFFGEASILKTNFHKSTVVPIRCSGLNIEDTLSDLPAQKSHFPIKYLGLPLTTYRLRRVDFQPLVDKAAAKLNGWSGRQLNHAGRMVLVKSVLTSQAIYLLTALRAPKATLKDIDAKRKQFLWSGNERLTGGKCKVNWTRTARSKKNGGLGILHLGKFARALRLRWLWREWFAENKPWIGDDLPCNVRDELLFTAATTIHIGNGSKIKFWTNAWLPLEVAPSIFKISRRKNRTLREALFGNAWIRDINLQNPSWSA